MWYSKEYNPIQVGSIDGTDIDPHDVAITRATLSNYRPPKNVNTDPKYTLFVSRLNFDTTEATLRPFFEKYGEISNIEVIRNNVTGLSQGYAFVTFTNSQSAREAYRDAHEATLDDHVILVDYERSRVMKNWMPRRFGGGYGGNKESGQLRFGARDRPFRNSHGKVSIDYDQKRSDNWRYSQEEKERSTSRDHHRRRRSSGKDRRRRSDSRDHHSSRCCRSNSRNHHHRSSRYDSDDSRHYRSDYKRKREDDYDDHSRSSYRTRHESSSHHRRH